MKYTIPAVAKAITSGVVAAAGAAAAAAGGADLSVLDWPHLLGALGAGLVAFGATFAVPNADGKPAVSPADQVIAALPTVVEQANQAAAELDRVKQAAADALGTTVQQVIDAVRPRP